MLFAILRPGADAPTHTGQSWEDNVSILKTCPGHIVDRHASFSGPPQCPLSSDGHREAGITMRRFRNVLNQSTYALCSVCDHVQCYKVVRISGHLWKIALITPGFLWSGACSEHYWAVCQTAKECSVTKSTVKIRQRPYYTINAWIFARIFTKMSSDEELVTLHVILMPGENHQFQEC